MKMKYNDNNEQSNSFIKSISVALQESDWLKPAKHDVYHECVYQPIQGLADLETQLDVLIVETLTVAVPNSVALRGIVVIRDLRDISDYSRVSRRAEYVDYLYLAIPDEPAMLKMAETVRRPEWGVMTVNLQRKIQIITQPQPLYPVNREDCLSSALIKMAVGCTDNDWII